MLLEVATRLEELYDAAGRRATDDVDFLRSLANGSDDGPAPFVCRRDLVWAAAFAQSFDISAAETFVKMRTQTQEEFDEAVEAHKSRQAMIAETKADEAVAAYLSTMPF